MLVDVCVFTCSESSIYMHVYLAGVTVIYMYMYCVQLAGVVSTCTHIWVCGSA